MNALRAHGGAGQPVKKLLGGGPLLRVFGQGGCYQWL